MIDSAVEVSLYVLVEEVSHRVRCAPSGDNVRRDFAVVVVRPVQVDDHVTLFDVVAESLDHGALVDRLALKRLQVHSAPVLFQREVCVVGRPLSAPIARSQ